MNKIKKTVVIAALICLFSTVSSCKTQSSDDNINISVSWWGGENRHEVTQAAIRRYEELHPDVHVSVQFGAWDGWEEKMAASFYAKKSADICQINWNWISDFSPNGELFVDMSTLSDYFQLENYDEEIISQCRVGGEVQGIPVSLTGRIFFWNSTVFEKAGINTPETLKELYAAGEIFKNILGEDYYPLVLTEYDRVILMVYYLESCYGKQWMENGKLNYTKEQIEEGLNFIMSLEDAHVIPGIKKITGDGAVSMDKDINWINGKYAGIFEWDSAATKFEQALAEGNELKVGNYMSDMGTYNGGFSKISMCFAISESAENKEECAKLLDFLLNDSEGSAIMGTDRGIPLSHAAYENCKNLNLIDSMISEANLKISEGTSYMLDNMFENAEFKSEPDGVYYDVMSGISYGDYTISEAAEIFYNSFEKT